MIYKDNTVEEKHKFGFRFGRYASRNGLGLFRGVSYDFYLMSVNSTNELWSQKTKSYAYGAGFSVWIQSVIKFNIEQKIDQDNRATINSSLLLNLDLFY